MNRLRPRRRPRVAAESLLCKDTALCRDGVLYWDDMLCWDTKLRWEFALGASDEARGGGAGRGLCRPALFGVKTRRDPAAKAASMSESSAGSRSIDDVR